MVNLKLQRCRLSRYYQIGVFVCVLGVLNGCASTEELYAEYDANCPVHLGQAKPGLTIVTDRITNEHMRWNPAVYFEFDNATLANTENQKLQQNLKVLTRYPQLQVAVRGFTDSRGSNAYNHGLAVRRVAAVSAYLKEVGLAVARVQPMPLGEELPILENESESTHAIHRRVELLLLDKQGRPVQTEISITTPLVSQAVSDSRDLHATSRKSTASSGPLTSQRPANESGLATNTGHITKPALAIESEHATERDLRKDPAPAAAAKRAGMIEQAEIQ